MLFASRCPPCSWRASALACVAAVPLFSQFEKKKGGVLLLRFSELAVSAEMPRLWCKHAASLMSTKRCSRCRLRRSCLSRRLHLAGTTGAATAQRQRVAQHHSRRHRQRCTARLHAPQAEAHMYSSAAGATGRGAQRPCRQRCTAGRACVTSLRGTCAMRLRWPHYRSARPQARRVEQCTSLSTAE